MVSSGGTLSANNGMLVGTTVQAGGSEDDYSGSTSGTVVQSGGSEDLEGSATGIGLVAGSGASVTDNATLVYAEAAGSSVVFGGVLSGSGTVVQDGPGTLVLAGAESGFTGAVTDSAGVVELAGGSVAGGRLISLVGSGTTLVVDGAVMPGATISGFFTGDAIELSGVAYDPSTTVTVSGGVVTVHAPSGSYVLTVAGASSAAAFAVGSAGNGGTLLTATQGGTILENGATETVSSGMTVSNVTVSSGGTLDVLAGGTALGTTVANGGNETLSGGTDSGTVLLQGGVQYVSPGGVAVGTVVSAGGEQILYGGVASGTVVSSGGYQEATSYYGSATTVGTVVSGGGREDLYYGNTASGTAVGSGGTLYLNGGTASNTVVSSGGSLSANNGMLLFSETSGTSFTVAGNVVGNGQIIQSGPGTVVLSGSESGFTGTITVSGGTVELASGAGAGSGGVDLAGNDVTVVVAGGVAVAPPISGFLPGDVADFKDLTVQRFVLSGTQLQLFSSGSAAVATISLAGSLDGYKPVVAGDGAGGSYVALSLNGGSIASPEITTITPVSLPDSHVAYGSGYDQTDLDITNAASAPADGLDVSILSSTGAAYGSGEITSLVPGASDSIDIAVGINNTVAGTQSGTVVLGLASDGSQTGSLVTLPSDTISASGRVFREAAYSFTQPDPVILHVGDDGGTASSDLTIANTSPNDGYSEDLIATSSGVISGDVSTSSGQTLTLAPGTSDANALSVAFSTATAGVVSGVIGLTLESTGTAIDTLGTTDLGSASTTFQATIDNHAAALVELVSGAGTLTVDGSSSTLDLGTLAFGSGVQTLTIGIENSASGPADDLGGTTEVSQASPFITESGLGAFSGLAAGALTDITVQVATDASGAFTQTISLSPTGSNASGFEERLPTQTLTIEGQVSDLAKATVEPESPIALGALHVGDTAEQTLTVQNSGDSTSQSLGANVLTATGAASGTGSIIGLSAGQTSSAVVLDLDTTQAGVQQGSVTLGFSSQDNASAVTPLPSQTIQLAGTVYREATPVVTAPDDAVVHVGESGTESITVTNSAVADGFSEGLLASVSGAEGDGFATGSTALLAAGAADDTSLSVDLPTATAGQQSETVTVGLQSDGSGTSDLGLTTLEPATVTVGLDVDNYADPVLTAAGDTLTQNGNTYTLDLGSVDQDSAPGTVDVAVENAALGLADLLSGGYQVVSGSGFTNTDPGAFTGLGAGQSGGGFEIGLASTSTPDTYKETIDLSTNGSNASGYSATFPEITLDVTAQVVATPAPDLAVIDIVPPSSALAGQVVPLSWTDTNQGDAAATGPWSDEVFLASDAAGDNPQLLGTFEFAGSLAAGQSTTQTENITLPTGTTGSDYFVVRTDAFDQVAEHSDHASEETIAASPTVISPLPQPSLVVTTIDPPTTAFSGGQTQVSWVVTNEGAGPTSSTYWIDKVYLSLDRTLDTSDTLLATVPNPSFLAPGASYQSSADVTLPQGVEGPYYIIVYTDADAQTGAHGGNTIVASQVTASNAFPVELSPAPDLLVSSIITPSQEFSGQSATVTYTVENSGSGPTDVASWNDGIYLSTDGMLDSNAVKLASVSHNGALAAGQSYTTSATITLPAGQSGSDTLFVVADSGSAVYELGSAGSHSASVPLQVNLTPPPDLVASVGALPAGVITAHSLTVSYTVTNSGSTATPNQDWDDTVYLSPDGSLDDAMALGTIAHAGALDVGQSYTTTTTFSLPYDLTGKYDVVVQADSGDAVFELNKINNVADGAASITVEFAPVELTVSNVAAPTTATAGHQILVSWQVTNVGPGDTSTSSWTDQVIASASGVLGASDNIVLATVADPGPLSGGGSYEQSTKVNIPSGLGGAYKLFIVTDSGNSIPGADISDDASAGQPLTVTPLPSLQVSAVTGPQGDTAGDTVTVNWAVTDTGSGATGANSWADNVYISTTPSLAKAAYLGTVEHTGALTPGAGYSAGGTFTLPINLLTGDYYFLVQTDAQQQVLQASTSGDLAASSADSVTQLPSTTPPSGTGSPATPVAPPSDLSVSTVTAPAEVFSGQPLTVSWTLADSGNPTSANWSDEVYLSRNQVLGSAADISLGTLGHSTPLAAGSTQTFTDTFTVPDGVSGPFYVLVSADAGDSLNDPDRTNNLAASAALQVDLPQPVDLTVASAAFEPTSEPLALPNGQTLPASDSTTVTYTVNNLSDAASSGSWEDAVYLSTTGVWSIDDPLLGYVQHTGGIVAGGSYTATLAAQLPGLVPGTYYAIVKTNVRDNQPESNLANNTGVSSNTIQANLPTLTLGTPSSGVLMLGSTAYYQFTVAAGQTVNLSLTSDAAGSANDIYVAYQAIPTIGQFTATSKVPLTQDPTATIQETQPGTYYVLVDESAGGQETYTLTASTVAFSITGITPDQGSNLGSVTLTIDGADFKANEQAEIIAPDGTTRVADKVAWVNSGELWATFNLQSLAVGGYTVALSDGSRTTSLADGFQVNNGPAGQLAVSLVAPSQLQTHSSPDGLSGTQAGIVTVVYSNIGQTDIPAPIFDLQATNAEFEAGVTGLVSPTEITVAGTNQTGPAGILQPGSPEEVSYTFAGNFGYAQFVTLELSLGVLQGSDATINWNSLEQATQPASVDSTDWSLIWQRFEAQFGTDTQGLIDALSQAATTLAQIGDPTRDLGTLLSYELQDATGTLPATNLVQTTDLAETGPGADLSLTRQYSASLLDRNAGGAFGDGWTFTYGIKAITDPSGNVFISSPSGTELFTLKPDGSYTAQTGDTSTLTFTSGSYVLTDATGDVETFRPDGQVSTVTDASGQVVTVHYDASGVISGVSSSNGQSISFTTNATGQITSATDSQGQSITYSYDATGQHLLSATGPGGTTSYQYDASGNAFAQNALTQITNPDGTSQSFQYDSLGSLSSQSESGGVGQVSYAYNGPGTVVETDASGNATTLIYDTNGNLAEVQDAAGDVSRLSYDGNGDLTEITGPDGSTYSFTYDAEGDLTGYTDPLDGTVHATYLPGTNELSSFTDQDGNTTDYSYDPAGNLTGITYDDGSGTTYQYNPSGELTGTSDARGQTTQYSYDANGNLLSEDFSDGTSQTYTYDSKGDLLSAKAVDGGVTSYSYNAAGDLTSVTDPAGRLESYGYNSGGQEVQRVEPDGSISNYSYTPSGQLAELSDGNGNLLVSYTYNAAGQLTVANMGNGASTSYSYDGLGNVTQIQTEAADGSVTSQLNYTYDVNSRPVTVTSLDGTWTYGRDAQGELTHAVFASTNPSIANQDLTYVYDAAGNRTETIFNGAVNNYTTNGLNQYIASDGTTYSYDADGNLVSMTQGGQTTTYNYNSQNELLSETGPNGTTSYTYDALGNQVSATVNGLQNDYVIDPLAISTSATGPLSAISQVYNEGGTVAATYDYANGLALQVLPGGENYYDSDATGNVTGLSSADGELIASYDYDPFGNVIYASGAGSNPFKFAGDLGEITNDTGDVFVRSRYYSSELGRFLSPDSSGLLGGANSYVYVDNRPTVSADLTGHQLVNYPGIGYASPSDLQGMAAASQYSGLTGYVPNFQEALPYVAGAAVGAAFVIGAFIGVDEAAALGAGAAALYDAIASSRALAYANYLAGQYLLFQQGSKIAAPILAVAAGTAGVKDLVPGQKGYGTLGDAIGKAIPVIGKALVDGVHSTDPNDIIGPTGSGSQAFIAKSATDAYTINFANSTTATAPAQQIAITEQLDPNLDWRTFRLTGFAFDNQTTTLSGNQAFYSALLDYSATKGYDVQVTAGVNVATGLVTWTFQTINPATGQAPQNPQLGLLPVDDANQDGEGFVSYTVQAKSTVQTGDTVSAQATVVFDTNAPINTPTITNTLDAVAPTSEVQALPAQEPSPDFEVSWSGTDDPAGSGIGSYTILVSDNGATPTVWLDDTTRTNAIFQGDYGQTYAFSSIATDNAGNVEALHAVPDTETTVAACYARGTLIRTPGGDVPIEDLRIGDLVTTDAGPARPIRWIGRRSYAGRFAARNPNVLPVLIRAGALAEGIPQRDLHVSPLHAMYIDGLLVPAIELVNGISILRQTNVQQVDYVHLEFDTHDVVIAEGAPSESFVDDDSRRMFHNAAEYRALYPDAAWTEACYFAPRLSHGFELEAIRTQINARATSQLISRGDLAA